MAVLNVPTRLAYQSLLVATDFSAHSQVALACAATIARKSKGKIYVAHVISPDIWPLGGPEDLHPALCKTRRSAEKKIASLLKSESLRDVYTDVLLKEGDLRTVLCKLTHDYNADLLVVGTRGRKGLSKLLFGSTAEDVCRAAPCPIMLIGPKVKAERKVKLDKIVFPTDLSAPSLGALPSVLALAEQHGAWLKFVRIMAADSDEQNNKDFALAKLQMEFGPVLTERTRLAHAPEFAIEFGPPAATILRVAKEWDGDLIAMGSQRPGTLASHFPGDLVYDVVCDSPCPVLTIAD